MIRRPRRRPFVAAAALLVVAASATSALACLWDYDTIRDGRRGLPGVAEVLSGKWERHSAFFYEDRVKRMTALVAREPNNWAAHDNLAVALEKLGRPAEAIAVMRRKGALSPDQYTSHANLGTFLLHTGQLDEGIAEIKRALAINPAAHFGREEYQLKLAEFLRDGRADARLRNSTNFLRVGWDEVLERLAEMQCAAGPGTAPASGPSPTASRPTSSPTTGPATSPADEVADLLEYALENQTHRMRRTARPGRLKDFGVKDNAVDALVGITRFGTGTSAEVYLTLGDLLALRGDRNLAYRAYLRGREFNHPRRAYLDAAVKELAGLIHDKASIAPEAIAAERAAADAWVAAYQRHEDDLIRAGKDPDDEANLARFYAAHGPAVVPVPFDFVEDVLPRDPDQRFWTVVLTGVAVVMVVVVAVRDRARRRRRRTAAPDNSAGPTARPAAGR